MTISRVRRGEEGGHYDIYPTFEFYALEERVYFNFQRPNILIPSTAFFSKIVWNK